jgi:hypothetical protein
MASDADTIANADLLWNLVHAVQDTIGKDGRPLVIDDKTKSAAPPLAHLRRLADEIDPENGRY